jgi:hypothetical protein
MKNTQKGFAVPLLLTLLAILIIGGGAYVYLNKDSKLSESDILKAPYTISANSIGEIPTTTATFPARTSSDENGNLTGMLVIYQDGTTSNDTLIGGKDYEAFWITKYEFNADHSEATVYIKGNFVGEGNDNRVFSVKKINGNVVTKEQSSIETSSIEKANTSASTTLTSCTSDKGKVMTYAKALELAKTSSCAKIGTFTGEYNCNQNAGGLVDVYMKPANHPNCGFACRISIDTGKAEEGWMCTMGPGFVK